MDTLVMTELLHCHICSADLKQHPLYSPTVAKTCARHGDFFVYHERGKDPVVIFRSFENPRTKRATSEKVSPAKTDRQRTRRRCKETNQYYVAVRCDQTGDVYPTQTAAAKALGVGQSEISDNIRGLNRTVGGYTFTRLKDDGMGGFSDIPRPVVSRNSSRYPHGVICNETGQTFKSIREASRELGIPKTTIRYRLHNNLTYKVRGEYTFSFVTSQKKHGLV